MPEGDTIFRTAVTLRKVAEGECIERAVVTRGSLSENQLVGARMVAIEARGKHLLMHLDRGSTVHSHMGMTGSWHCYRHGEPWQKPDRWAWVALHTGRAVLVCFTPKTLELLSKDQLRRHRWLGRLGPDILATELDLESVMIRIRPYGTTEIGETLVNQTVVCGIGNVYKSESLFLEGINPFAKVGSLERQACEDLIKRGRQLMLANLQGFPRVTRFRPDGPRQWVYGRAGQSCFRCGTTIRMRRQGDLGRSTYWCPACQP